MKFINLQRGRKLKNIVFSILFFGTLVVIPFFEELRLRGEDSKIIIQEEKMDDALKFKVEKSVDTNPNRDIASESTTAPKSESVDAPVGWRWKLNTRKSDGMKMGGDCYGKNPMRCLAK